jgi:N-acetylglucosamine-6-phosphate deacetylase
MSRSTIVNAGILEDASARQIAAAGGKAGRPPLHDIFIEEGRITAITSAGNRKPAGVVTDARGAWAAPGFIDIHTHGGLGADVMDRDPEALAKLARFQLSRGVTSFLATTLTAPLADIEAAICRARAFWGAQFSAEPLAAMVPCARTDCARLAGVHLEGPCLSAKNSGAQDAALLRVPDSDATAFVLDAADVVRRITIAPDLPGAIDFIRAAKSAGIGVSGGHDNAIDDEIYPAMEAGMDCVTHIYCCSSTISRRDGPRKHLGLTEIGMADNRLSVEAIADGLHVPDSLFSLILKAKGADKVCLVSDSLRVAGMPDGEYRLGDSEKGLVVEKRGGEVSVPGLGVYAGSSTDVGAMVVRVVANCEVPLRDAVLMATAVPARLAGLTDRGILAVGKLADINLLEDDGSVAATFLGGIRT